MTAKLVIHRISLARAFIGVAAWYWLSIYPQICRETKRWHRRAEQMPSAALRDLAREAQEIKRGNIEGSAAFAILAPCDQRPVVVRAQVAFQSVYDYVDTLSEQPHPQPIRNSRQLHQALLDSLDADPSPCDYYAHQQSRNDGGYLEELVSTCRQALCGLPSYATVAPCARRVTERIVAYQTLNLSEAHGGHLHLARWARDATPPDSGLHWWETAASAGSSLGLFALIAAAAQPDLTEAQALAIEAAYWPWVGALHSLLDSLVDDREDAAAGQRGLLDYYRSPEEAADRLELLARRAIHATSALNDASKHALILAGMASFYLTSPEADSPVTRPAARRILQALGRPAKPSVLVFRIRRAISRASPRGTRHA